MEFLELIFSRHGTCKLLCDTSLALARSSPTRRYTGSSLPVRDKESFPCLFLTDLAPSSLGLPVSCREEISLSRTETHEESSISVG